MTRRASLLLAGLALVLTGCVDVDEILSGRDRVPTPSTSASTGAPTSEPADDLPDQLADYLRTRERSRDGAARLARGLADALGGTPGTIDGDPTGCLVRDGEALAFTYAVRARVDGVRPDGRWRVVEEVLRALGWTPYDARRERGPGPAGPVDRVDAARDDVSVSVGASPLGDDVVMLTVEGGCFAIPADRRREVDRDLDDERIVVPGPGG